MYIPSVEEKVGNWVNAYRAIRDELTMPELRAAQDLMNRTEGMLVSSLAVARLIYANDRAAAMTAAIITTYGGVRPLPLEVEGEVSS
jgi:hypothetical protein